jgi:brefeldin A-resistance guanine nucleotide exchange factor 1
MNGFLDLKREVRDADGKSRSSGLGMYLLTDVLHLEIDTLPLTTLFAPFFALIRSPLSTGPITSAALWAIHNLFIAGFVTPNSPGLDAALAELSNTVSHCKFEASDASGDEVVLYRIMAVIECCMCGSVGNVLGDVEVCEMLETVLTTCCQMRLSGKFINYG